MGHVLEMGSSGDAAGRAVTGQLSEVGRGLCTLCVHLETDLFVILKDSCQTRMSAAAHRVQGTEYLWCLYYVSDISLG